jgi:hypothetical protein
MQARNKKSATTSGAAASATAGVSSPAIPTVEELQHAVKQHLQQHPDINKMKIDKLLQPLGHSIVWTPPFVPEVQPIK